MEKKFEKIISEHTELSEASTAQCFPGNEEGKTNL